MTGGIAVVDLGSQYTRLIARRIREDGVFTEILPHTTSAAELRARGARGVILSGGPASVTDAGAPGVDPALLDGSIPVLGICYGMQWMARALGGRVAAGATREYGRAEIAILNGGSPIFAGLAPRAPVWMSHGDRVEALPPGFHALASSDGAPVVAFSDEAGRRFGIQFHPEVAHTPSGRRILSNFARGICGAERTWTAGRFAEEAVEAIRARVGGTDRVVLGVSGGVDSFVAAALLRRAIGDRLVAVFVENGLLRAGEADEVRLRYGRDVGGPLVIHDASARFLAALHGVEDPEEKRRRIGAAFIEAFREGVRAAGREGTPPRFLAQGTLYPDVIESAAGAAGPAAKIKTHHNVGGLPKDLGFELIEPLRLLFKDEVRRVGESLGLSRETLGRHPFPGPGLAVRVLGVVTPERLARIRAADRIFLTELRAAGLYDRVAQAFAVLLPVRSVGVQGDFRTYDETVALRAVTSDDFMTADWADLPGELLRRVSGRITNEVRGVNRVVYDVSSKPPATIEWE